MRTAGRAAAKARYAPCIGQTEAPATCLAAEAHPGLLPEMIAQQTQLSRIEPLDFDQLSTLVSAARLQAYLSESRDSKALAADLYVWDLEMAGALWDLIAYVEIAIRNAMARELAGLRRKKSPRAAWFNNSEWFTSQQRAAIRKAKETTRAKGTTEGRVVAQLMFGFWASLLDPAHEHSLWVPGLRLAFPNSSGERKHVHGNVRSINDLRNDIAHHNRIFNRDIHKTEDR